MPKFSLLSLKWGRCGWDNSTVSIPGMPMCYFLSPAKTSTLLYFKGKNLWFYDKIWILLQQFLKTTSTKFDILTLSADEDEWTQSEKLHGQRLCNSFQTTLFWAHYLKYFNNSLFCRRQQLTYGNLNSVHGSQKYPKKDCDMPLWLLEAKSFTLKYPDSIKQRRVQYGKKVFISMSLHHRSIHYFLSSLKI